MKVRRLANPARKRRMSLAQKLHFGSKRQRVAAAQAMRGRRSNPNRKSTPSSSFRISKKRTKKLLTMPVKWSSMRRAASNKRRRRNVGRILTYSLANPAKRRRKRKLSNSNSSKGRSFITMATRRRRRTRRSLINPRRRRAVSYRRRRRTSLSNPAPRRRRRRAVVHHRRRRRSSNPSVRTVVRYRNRSRHSGRRHHRRRNLSVGGAGSAVTVVGGILGGAALTSFVSKMMPASLHTGFMGIAANAAIAIVGGKMVGKVFKSPALGKYMTYGGLVYVGMQILNQFFPSLSGYVPFGLNGMGLIAGSSFYTPQVNLPGSMGQFVTPAAVPAASLKGLIPGNAFGRRMGRMG